MKFDFSFFKHFFLFHYSRYHFENDFFNVVYAWDHLSLVEVKFDG